MDKKREAKNRSQPAKGKSGAQRRRRDDRAPKASEQRGAVETEVIPTTPPMAESDELPHKPVHKTRADDEIDAPDEMTPG